MLGFDLNLVQTMLNDEYLASASLNLTMQPASNLSSSVAEATVRGQGSWLHPPDRFLHQEEHP
jgi:hypothetical protein